jgi:hypothetical protein
MAGIPWRGRRACSCVIGWAAAFEKRAGHRLAVYQGSYSSGVKASAGTHSGGGALDVTSMSRGELNLARKMGAAAWNRTRAQGFSPHCHIIICGCPHAARGAKYQVSEYRAGRNGLASRRRDDGPRPGYVTWAAYKREHLAKAKAAPKRAVKAKVTKPARPAPMVINGKKYNGLAVVTVANVNKCLAKLGLYKGKRDGLWGPETQAGFDRFRAGLGWKGKDITGPVGLKSLGLLNDRAHSPLPVKEK